MKYEDINNRFTYYKPETLQIAKYNKLRDDAKDFALMLNDACPDSREKSIAITKLEECIMWANAAIARNK